MEVFLYGFCMSMGLNFEEAPLRYDVSFKDDCDRFVRILGPITSRWNVISKTSSSPNSTYVVN